MIKLLLMKRKRKKKKKRFLNLKKRNGSLMKKLRYDRCLWILPFSPEEEVEELITARMKMKSMAVAREERLFL